MTQTKLSKANKGKKHIQVKATLLPPTKRRFTKEQVHELIKIAQDDCKEYTLQKAKEGHFCLGRKSAMNAIRKKQAKVVLVDTEVPKCIQDALAGFANIVGIDGLSAKILKSMGQMKVERKKRKFRQVNFFTLLLDHRFSLPELEESSGFSVNINIYDPEEKSEKIVN